MTRHETRLERGNINTDEPVRKPKPQTGFEARPSELYSKPLLGGELNANVYTT
jgi:hypothetical protein